MEFFIRRDVSLTSFLRGFSGIVGAHLHEMRTAGENGRPHLPAKPFGFTVLERLKKKGWNGPVTLGYLHE